MQANPLNGNALKSLDEMSDALTHEVCVKDALAPRTLTSSTAIKRAESCSSNYNGHRDARTR